MAPLWDLCGSAVDDSCPNPALLTVTLMFNPILTVSSFSSPSRSVGHEYPKVCLLDRIIPPFQSHGGQFFNHKKTHSMDLLLSCLDSFIFLFFLTPFSLLFFVSLGLYKMQRSTQSKSSSAALPWLSVKHAHEHHPGLLELRLRKYLCILGNRPELMFTAGIYTSFEIFEIQPQVLHFWVRNKERQWSDNKLQQPFLE